LKEKELSRIDGSLQEESLIAALLAETRLFGFCRIQEFCEIIAERKK